MQTADLPPNQTIYVNNLNEKVKKDELRKALYALFSQFGPILDVVALKTDKMRGQAFIVFKDVASATNALRTMQNFHFYDKPMRIQYAKTKSDAVARLDGTYQPRQKRASEEKRPEKKRKAEEKPSEKRPEKRKAEEKAAAAAAAAAVAAPVAPVPTPTVPAQPRPQPPNKILFVENLPQEATPLMLQMLFQQFPGFKEVRMVPGKPGIAFVEYETELESSVAMRSLQHFKITPEHLMLISYARR